MKRADTGAQFICRPVAPSKLRNLEEPEPMRAGLGRVTKAGAKGFRSLKLHYSGLGPSREGQIVVPAVDALTSNISARAMLGSTRQ